jgi:hypothetical protein
MKAETIHLTRTFTSTTEATIAEDGRIVVRVLIKGDGWAAGVPLTEVGCLTKADRDFWTVTQDSDRPVATGKTRKQAVDSFVNGIEIKAYRWAVHSVA